MIANPIIRKEVLLCLRTRKAVGLQVVFLLVTAALVWLLWPVDGLQDIGGLQWGRILSVLAMAQLLMVALLAPAFTAAAMTGERERNTLESLFSTALSPGQIALGKVVGSLGPLVLIVASGLPALASPMLLGGLSGGRFLATAAVLLVTAVYLGMIGLVVSCFSHRSYRSIIVTFAVLLVVLFLSAVPVWPISGNLIARGGPAWQATFHAIASFSPLQAMASLVMPKSAYARGAQNMPPFWCLYLVQAAAVSLLAAGVCWAKLRSPIRPPRPREKLKVIERGKITARTFFFVIDPRKRKRMIFGWQNPVLIKEFRTRPMLQPHWLLRAVGICLIASVALMFLVTLGVQAFVGESMTMMPTMAMAVAAMMVVLIVLIGPALTGGAICADRESGVWDLMRTTRLSSWTIVSGKFQAAIIPLALIALAMAGALAILLYFNVNLLPSVVRICCVVGMTVLVVSATGTFFSSLFARTATATAWTYAVVVALSLLTLLVLLGEDLFSQRLVRAVFVVNPVAAALDAAGHARMKSYALLAPHLKIMGVAAAVLLAATIARVHQLRGPSGRAP